MAGARRRRLDQPREVVLRAARDAIAEHGLAELTMAGLGRRVGTSGGHILYYFGSKDRLLVETLRWSEQQLAEVRAGLLREAAPVTRRLAAYVDLYLPTGRADPRWILWLEVWGRSLADPEVLAAAAEIERPWALDLAALLREGARDGTCREVDTDAFTVSFHALLDGLAVRVVTGVPGASRAGAAREALAYATDRLANRPAAHGN
jgi:AcrR family transcriptional regulator